MRSMRRTWRAPLAALLALSLIAWTVAPATSHAAAVFETLRQHAEMVADHGHSHGFEEDLYAALHGHSHDAADHDHSEALPGPGASHRHAQAFGDARRPPPARAGPARPSRIDRPPRP